MTRPGPSWEKKDKNCDPDDPDDRERGSYWDHVLFDPETKLVITLVVGRRTAETVFEAFTDFFERTDGALPELLSTDEYAPYQTVIYHTWGLWQEELDLCAEDQEQRDEASCPDFYFPEEIAYATVHKHRRRGRVVGVEPRVVFGTEEQVAEALAGSGSSEAVNISYVERYNGTQRHFNSRKKRKAYTFSKELSFHEACTWLVIAWYNFGWCVRTLRQQVQESPPRYRQRTPAMAAGLADRPWSMERFLNYPLYPCNPPSPAARNITDKNAPDCDNGKLEGG